MSKIFGLALVLLATACADSDPPSGRYQLTWQSTGDGCEAGIMPDTLDVDGAVMVWRWTGSDAPAGSRLEVTGTISGTCIAVDATETWREYEVCADGDGVTAEMHNVAGTCGRRMRGSR